MMNFIELKARAKINLSLDVLSKRPDGYHDVKMIMQSIDLHDRINIENINNGIEIACKCQWVPEDSRNIAYKAADLLIRRFDIKRGVKINIIKNIPVAAGLAGGSTDAAAVLRGMNSMFELGLEDEELMILGKELGADVPYCIKGGTMLAEGIGEMLTNLKPMPETHIVLIKPRLGVSTAWVYGSLKLDCIKDRPDTDFLINAIERGEINALARNMKNVLESVTATKYDIINRIKKKLVDLGALGSMMSGSGPAVFGIFADESSAKRAYAQMESSNWDRYLTRTVSSMD